MARARVVLVEDEAAIRVGLSQLLGGEGFNVDTAAGGAEALRLLAGPDDVDALLVDLFLPDMSGRDLVHAIRAGGRHAGVPILLMTGAVHSAEAFPPPDQYQHLIEKPFDVATVVEALRRVTRDGRGAGEQPSAVRATPSPRREPHAPEWRSRRKACHCESSVV